MSAVMNSFPPVTVELVTDPIQTQDDLDMILNRCDDYNALLRQQDSDPEDDGYGSGSSPPSVNMGGASDFHPSEDCGKPVAPPTALFELEHLELGSLYKQIQHPASGCEEYVPKDPSGGEIEPLFPTLDPIEELFNTIETGNNGNLQDSETSTTDGSSTSEHAVEKCSELKVPSFESLLQTDNEASHDITDMVSDDDLEVDSNDPDYVPPGKKFRQHKSKSKKESRHHKAYKNVYKVKSTNKRTRRHTAQLWVFLLNCLIDEQTNPSVIEWQNKKEGTFVLKDSKKIASLWGKRVVKSYKKPMDYEKFSRAIRYYYRKNIILSVPQRLTYKFGPNAVGWRELVEKAVRSQ